MKIKLRKIKSSDWKYFLNWWKDKELIKLTSGISEKSDQVLLGYFKELLNSPKDYHLIILLNAKVIGHIALSRINKNTAEIHIIIGENKYRGKGLGPLSIKKAIKFAFDKLKYKRIVLEVRPENKRAILAYKKCGFIEKGLKKYLGTQQPATLVMALNKQV